VGDSADQCNGDVAAIRSSLNSTYSYPTPENPNGQLNAELVEGGVFINLTTELLSRDEGNGTITARLHVDLKGNSSLAGKTIVLVLQFQGDEAGHWNFDLPPVSVTLSLEQEGVNRGPVNSPSSATLKKKTLLSGQERNCCPEPVDHPTLDFINPTPYLDHEVLAVTAQMRDGYKHTSKGPHTNYELHGKFDVWYDQVYEILSDGGLTPKTVRNFVNTNFQLAFNMPHKLLSDTLLGSSEDSLSERIRKLRQELSREYPKLANVITGDLVLYALVKLVLGRVLYKTFSYDVLLQDFNQKFLHDLETMYDGRYANFLGYFNDEFEDPNVPEHDVSHYFLFFK
jgi:hypothetical protein